MVLQMNIGLEIVIEFPEAPIPVVNINGKDFRLGGAGNVAKFFRN